MDLASFNSEHILNIFGWARCWFCGTSPAQGHHVKGRGKMKDNEDRKMHSSPFNYAPLCEKCHSHAPVNDDELVAFFLRKAAEKVFYAIARGVYEMTEIDERFRERYVTGSSA